jgi:malate synthase
MSAFIPNRREPEVTERALARVREDKEREAGDGFDGTWVAHPDVVVVAAEAFDRVLGDRPNQIERRREDVEPDPRALLAVPATPGAITEDGLRSNLSVGFQYISFWLGGRGAVGLDNLMEDAATAEISRAQIWQWIHHGARLEDGRVVTAGLVSEILDEEIARIRGSVDERTWIAGHPEETRQVFEQVALGPTLPDFLTIPAYGYLP